MRSLICFLPLLSLISPTTCQVIGTSLVNAEKSGRGTLVYVYNEVGGFTESSDDGVDGFLIDLMSEFESYVKKEKGITLSSEFLFMDDDFPRFMKTVQQAKGGVFGLGNVSIRPERRALYDFSPPFLDNISVLITSNNVAELSSLRELPERFSGMVGYSIESTTNEERMQKIKTKYLPDLEIKYFDSTNEVLQNIVKNTKAFAVIDLNFYLGALNERLPIKRHAVGDEKDDPFGIIMPKDCDWSPLLTDFFDSGFIQSARYSEIISKNLGNSALRLLNRIKTQ